MPERCPICDTELGENYYCQQCRRSVEADILKGQVKMLEGAIAGWRRTNADLQRQLAEAVLERNKVAGYNREVGEQLFKAKQQNAELAAVVERYGWHDRPGVGSNGCDDHLCVCGFDEALEQSAAILAEHDAEKDKQLAELAAVVGSMQNFIAGCECECGGAVVGWCSRCTLLKTVTDPAAILAEHEERVMAEMRNWLRDRAAQYRKQADRYGRDCNKGGFGDAQARAYALDEAAQLLTA